MRQKPSRGSAYTSAMALAALTRRCAASTGAARTQFLTRVVIVIGLAMAGGGCSDRQVAGPDEVVISLYRTLALQQVRGAPSPTQLAAIEPFLGADLHSKLRAAREVHEAERARAPDEKPPFTDGDLFTSLFEGPTSFEIVSDTVQDAAHHVTVRFTYAKASPPVTWTDVVVVVSEDGRWVVTDVIYGGEWDFANHGTLRKALNTP